MAPPGPAGRIRSDSREGPRTGFGCDTRIGPLALTEVMEITARGDERPMGVRHVGMVKGTGEFLLGERGSQRSEFRGREDLTFPRFMHGPSARPRPDRRCASSRGAT